MRTRYNLIYNCISDYKIINLNFLIIKLLKLIINSTLLALTLLYKFCWYYYCLFYYYLKYSKIKNFIYLYYCYKINSYLTFNLYKKNYL